MDGAAVVGPAHRGSKAADDISKQRPLVLSIPRTCQRSHLLKALTYNGRVAGAKGLSGT